jgi:transposase
MPEPAKPRLREVQRHQLLAAIELDQLVGPEHPVRTVWQYVEALDLSPLLASIKAVEGSPGRDATDPKILLSLWLWAFTQGVGSARALETLCQEHHAYRWLVGGVSLNYHTLASFRSSNADVLDGFLQTHVTALLHAGLIELTCVAQDGLRTRASAGASSFHRPASLAECQQAVQAQRQALQRQEGEAPDAVSRRQQAARQRHARERQERLAQAQQVAAELGTQQAERARGRPKEAQRLQGPDRTPRGSTTDPEARRMKMPDGGTRPAYNLQCATTAETGIIVAVAVTNQGNDSGLMGPMLEQIEKRYQQRPQRMLVDGGFNSKQDVEEAQARGITVYTALKNERKDQAAGKNPYRPKAADGPGMAALRVRMGTAAAKTDYQKRSIAEWVNAGMRQRGLSRLTVRGSLKVRAVLLWQALVHNLWQTQRLRQGQKHPQSWPEILRAATV